MNCNNLNSVLVAVLGFLYHSVQKNTSVSVCSYKHLQVFQTEKMGHLMKNHLPFFCLKNKGDPVCSSKTETTDNVQNICQAYVNEALRLRRHRLLYTTNKYSRQSFGLHIQLT